MEEILLLLKRVILLLVGGGAAFLTLFMALFTLIMFLVPTSSPYQVEEWTNTVVIVFGIKTNQLWIQRLKGLPLVSVLRFPLLPLLGFHYEH
jgi:hypothetical protein